MSGPIPERLTSENAHLRIFLSELETIIRSGFKGQLQLNCPGDGTVPTYQGTLHVKTGSGQFALLRRRDVT